MTPSRVRRVSVTDARRRCGALLSQVRRGETVVLTRRHAPVAVLEGTALYIARRVSAEDDEAFAITPALEAVWHRAILVLGDKDRARHWLLAPRRTLGGRTPIEAVIDGDADRVHQVMAAVEHGIVL